DPISRKRDSRAGLDNFVRLSFCSNNPMMHVAKQKGRISHPVLLKIKLEVVSRPGVLFSDCNALRKGAVISNRPEHINFDIVKMKNMFDVPTDLRHFYQAEVLIPSPLPPHLIIFPNITTTTLANYIPAPSFSPSSFSLSSTLRQSISSSLPSATSLPSFSS